MATVGSSSGGETKDSPSGWTVDTLSAHVQSQIDYMKILLDERYLTQTKAVDAAFLAQQTAMQTALTAAETAVSKALESAEKAVIKAETAADKRFEAVNEFRAQLTDQAATFMPRLESEASMTRNAERITQLTTSLGEQLPRSEFSAVHEALLIRVQDLADRVNKTEGSANTVLSSRLQLVSFIGAATSIIAVILAIYAIVKP